MKYDIYIILLDLGFLIVFFLIKFLASSSFIYGLTIQKL
jgi:hypothetical protein